MAVNDRMRPDDATGSDFDIGSDHAIGAYLHISRDFCPRIHDRGGMDSLLHRCNAQKYAGGFRDRMSVCGLILERTNRAHQVGFRDDGVLDPRRGPEFP